MVNLQTHRYKNSEAKTRNSIGYKYSKDDFDFLWVVTPSACYLIPSKVIYANKETKTSLTMCPKWGMYRVAIPIPKRDKNKYSRLSPHLTMDEKMLVKRLLKIGKSYKEIANILDVSPRSIESQIYRNKTFYTLSPTPKL
mgnify:FL=1